jgi:multisubunit Na+/H+ antiporter MnhF subunit
VNAFGIAATVLFAGFLPLGVVLIRANAIDAAIPLQLFGSVTTLILLCLAESFHRSVYFDVPVICAVMSWVGGLVYVRFLGRWL